MSKEVKDLFVMLIENMKAEIDEIEESIGRLSYRANNTKDVSELKSIKEEIKALNADLKEDIKELKSLIKKYKKEEKKK